jgi:hypothetical protein
MKLKVNDELSQTINDSVYEWLVAQRAKKIPVSGPVLQAYARKVAEELGVKFKIHLCKDCKVLKGKT